MPQRFGMEITLAIQGIKWVVSGWSYGQQDVGGEWIGLGGRLVWVEYRLKSSNYLPYW